MRPEQDLADLLSILGVVLKYFSGLVGRGGKCELLTTVYNRHFEGPGGAIRRHLGTILFRVPPGAYFL